VVANAKNDPMYALETLQRAADLQQQTPDARLDAQIQLARGVALQKLRRLPESLTALERALAIFRETDSLLELSATFSELALVNADMGNWRAAYENQTQSQSTVETLLRNQRDQRFATLKVEFDTAAKEKENQLLMRENEVNAKAIAEGTRARKLQAAVIAMTAVLAALLVALAVHQRRITRRMRTLAMTDELTGVPNRRAVLGRIVPLLQEEGHAPCSILVVDIDHFKSINDRFGHPIGDEALRMVTSKLGDALREPAFMGRLGGEEFVIVLPDTDLEAAVQTAERLREQVLAIDTRRLLNERQLTVSIGVTTSMTSSDTISSMLKRADSALYAAKYAGRNCVKSEPALAETVNSRVA
jgi:diguanylate cyclase (GGDEF)-like protein